MPEDEHYLYPLGLDVRYGTRTSPIYRILDRHVQQRDLFGGLPEYLLAANDGTQLWVAEMDIWPLDAEEDIGTAQG